jgi:hypothetical protein
MDETEKAISSSLPQMSMAGQADFQPNDLLALKHLLSEVEPIAAVFTSEIIGPLTLRFIPENRWSGQSVSLQSLQHDYFSRKNNVSRRFEHKLWNALCITSAFPNTVKLVGVVWVTDSAIKVDKYSFAKLLNISAIDGGLFPKQGNFPRHGFVALSDAEARQKVPPEHLVDVGFRDVLLIWHPSGQFTRAAPEERISACQWDNPAGTTRVATLRVADMLGPRH